MNFHVDKDSRRPEVIIPTATKMMPAMIIAGIIFVAVGIITSGLRESLSTWKFITGAACFAFGGICAAVYAFSQGETVPLDNQF